MDDSLDGWVTAAVPATQENASCARGVQNSEVHERTAVVDLLLGRTLTESFGYIARLGAAYNRTGCMEIAAGCGRPGGSDFGQSM
jgi:hypothetical protein